MSTREVASRPTSVLSTVSASSKPKEASKAPSTWDASRTSKPRGRVKPLVANSASKPCSKSFWERRPAAKLPSRVGGKMCLLGLPCCVLLEANAFNALDSIVLPVPQFEVGLSACRRDKRQSRAASCEFEQSQHAASISSILSIWSMALRSEKHQHFVEAHTHIPVPIIWQPPHPSCLTQKFVDLLELTGRGAGQGRTKRELHHCHLAEPCRL